MMRRILLMALILLRPIAAHAQAPSEQIARGEYVTRAADCAACHTLPGGEPFTGGRAFKLPIGVVYSPNITPDATTGIGQYTDAEWLRVIHRGINRAGAHLYPAMPYPSYTRMSDDDALAIKAYLFSLKPVHAVAPVNQVKFPFDQRWLMVFWNLVNNPNSRFSPDPSQSVAWNRGAYLVEALGHCGECHTPRNFMQALSSRTFAGTVQAGWLAYNLTSDPAHGLGGWSDAALTAYLSKGTAPGHGPASGPMGEAVGYSLRYMTPRDITAIVTYLRTVPTQPDGPDAMPATTQPVETSRLGQRIFVQACAGCHLPNGGGRQSPWAALGGSHSTGDVTGINIVEVLASGTQIQTDRGLMFMHRFTEAYTDQELAAVANYVIGDIGGRRGQVSAQQIATARNGAGAPTNKSDSGS
jgi:mono/diheme cytochrome c family protein